MALIAQKQISLIHKGIAYINKQSREGIDVEHSALCYLNTWANVPGHALLKFWQNGFKSIVNFILVWTKSLLGILTLHSFEVAVSKTKSKLYSNIIVSWCRREDFDIADGYNDRYFKARSDSDKNILWFLISIDNFLPSNLDENVMIFYKNKSIFKYNIFSFLKIIYSEIISSSFSLNKILHRLSYDSIFSQIVANKLIDSISDNTIENICLPYEAQPLHNNIFSKIKLSFDNVRTIGYLHSALPPLMTDLIYRKGAPDRLFVHGVGQIEILNTFLNWPKETLFFTKSFRYRQKDLFKMQRHVFLPYDFFNLNLYVQEFEYFLKNSNIASLPNLKIRNHPNQSKSSKHLRLIEKLNTIIFKYKNRFSENSTNLSVFIGATASIIEALEQNIKVVHITTDPIFESHSSEIWEHICVETISKNIFIYSLNQNEMYINKGDNNLSLKSFFTNNN
jgi:hypothetical protein